MENKKFRDSISKAARTGSERRERGIYLTDEEAGIICKLVVLVYAVAVLAWCVCVWG